MDGKEDRIFIAVLKQPLIPRAYGIELQRIGWGHLKEEKGTKGTCGEGRRRP
jgi:hypothetical protein